MSGAGQGFQGDQWHGKQLIKNLIGLPVAGAIGSPQWIKKNPQSAMAAAAVAATVLSMGAAAPAIGAAGAGAAGAGEAAAAGAGTAAAEAGAAGAAEAGAATGAFDMAGSAGTGLLGAGGTDVMTGASAGSGLLGQAGTGASSGLLQTLGGMGPEQANILAAQNAGLGFGADSQTLAAANTAGGGHATLGAQLSPYYDKAKMGMDAFSKYQKTQAALDAAAPRGGNTTVSAPPRQSAPAPIIGSQTTDPMPTTPFSPYDPLWVAYLKRHPELGAQRG